MTTSTAGPEARAVAVAELWRRHGARLLILGGIIVAITFGHYTVAIRESHYHEVFRRLYYLPIILAGLWFQVRGGLASAILVSLIYAPHVVLQWGSHPDTQWEQSLEILLYNVIGLLSGIAARRDARQRSAQEKTAARLDRSYQQLKDQASQILAFEEQLLRASRLSALGELAAGLAHEIRNPLGSIRGTAEIVKDPATSPGQREEFAEVLVREVDRLNQVVSKFLRFAKPDPVGRQAVCINQVLDELLEFSAAEYRRQRIEVRFDRAELPRIPVDADQLRQVLLNILLNAVQALSTGGVVRVTTLLKEDSVVVQIADNGPGIAPEVLPRIFNPFYTTRQSGTGLGLAISQRIVQAHGGQIGVQSRPGEGAVFEVMLPAGN